jgi:type IV pilus assembly protein PilB
VTPPKKRLGEVLVDAGVLSADGLDRALRDQRAPQEKLGEAVIRLGLASETSIAQALSDQLAIPFIDLSCAAIEPEAIQLVPERTARKHTLLPISIDQRDLQVAIADPLSFEALEDVAFASGCTVRPLIATATDIRRAADKHYNLAASLSSLVKDIEGDWQVEVLRERQDADPKDTEDLRKRSEAAPIVRMVNLIMAQAVDQGASDIHVEPARTSVIIRTRVDGILRRSLEAPKWVQAPVTSRIKIMARMDIAEKRLPQDGRIAVRVGEKSLDLRVSTVPSSHGEKVVIRVLDSANATTPLDGIGLGVRQLAQVDTLIRRPQGIVLVTGPTGAGKTSTLYAMLNRIKSVERSITTIEDPIEYELAGVNQTAVQEKIGLTFASMLRATLRQDPDVIMVGEMRDAETGNIAMQASITGHLVLSTMHTNSAVATVTRLRNLGLPSYMIASAVSGVIAQRLVRRICPLCRVQAHVDDADRDRLVMYGCKEAVPSFAGAGCTNCHGTGYKGRAGVFEVLAFDSRIRDIVASNAHESAIRRTAIDGGMETLFAAALRLVREGETTLAELYRVIDTDEIDVSVCPSCDEHVEADFIACPSCRQSLAASCPSCQRRLSTEWTVCPYCAADLDTPSAAIPLTLARAGGRRRTKG